MPLLQYSAEYNKRRPTSFAIDYLIAVYLEPSLALFDKVIKHCVFREVSASFEGAFLVFCAGDEKC